jgi:tetratricopeptide (TPR) repeat protein
MGIAEVWRRIARRLGLIDETTPLDRAQQALARGQVEEAIFFCRSVLFTTLMSLAQAARLPRPSGGDQDEKAYYLNDSLARAGVYAEPVHKQIQGWVRIGEQGLAGALDEVPLGDVQRMISEMDQFIRLVSLSLDLYQPVNATEGNERLPQVSQPIPSPRRPPPQQAPLPPPMRPRELTAPGMVLPLGNNQMPSVVGTMPRVPGFVGRGHSVMRLAGLLRQGRHVALVPLENGQAGVGLSAVAAETVAVLEHDVPSVFAGGIVALHGFGRQGEEALRWAYRSIGMALGVPAISQAPSLNAQEQELRRVLRGNHLLVVLDQMELGFPAQRFLDALVAAEATVLLTCRQVPRAEQLSVFRLEPLAPPAALNLLQDRFNEARGDAHDWHEDIGRTICGLLEMRPLALELAATLGAMIGLPSVEQRLDFAARRGMLTNRGEPNQPLRYLIDLLLNSMDASDSSSLASLAIFAGHTWKDDAAQAVIHAVENSFAPAQESGPRAGATLARLVHTRLVQSAPSAISGVRYALQPFMRGTLARLLVDRPVITDLAGQAMTAHYAGVALALRKATNREAIVEEYTHLEAGLQWAQVHNEPELVVTYGMGLYRFWQRQGLWLEAERYLQWAIRAAQEIGDRPREAQLAQELGVIFNNLGQRVRAVEWYERALGIWRSLGNARNEATVLFDLGRMSQDEDDPQMAQTYYEGSLRAARADDDEQGQGRALQALGLVAESLGQPDEARRYYELVYEMRQSAGDVIGQAGALNVLGVLELRQGRLSAANDHLQASLAFAQQIGSAFWEAEAYFWLGETAIAGGNREQARAMWQNALPIYLSQGRSNDVAETQRRLLQLAAPGPQR